MKWDYRTGGLLLKREIPKLTGGFVSFDGLGFGFHLFKQMKLLIMVYKECPNAKVAATGFEPVTKGL